MTFAPAPLSLDEVLDPAWLSQALSDSNPASEVTGVSVVETIATMATKVRIAVDYAEPDPALPDTLCVKGYFGGTHPRSRTRNAVAEARFYRELAPTSGLLLPRCRYAGVDENIVHGVIVMDDVVAHGGVFLNALSAFTADEVAASLHQLALIHGGHWGTPALRSTPWLSDRMSEMVAAPSVSVAEIDDMFAGERGAGLPASVRKGQRIEGAVGHLVAFGAAWEQTMIHGDAHAGNVFELAGRRGLVDWQVIQRGFWAVDVAYHIASTLTVAQREACEVDLLRSYMESLAGTGVTPPTWDEAWLGYRASMAYGYYLWCITRRVAPAITHELLHRLGSAVAALQTFELLESR